jgi:hypothetical protein
MTEARRRFVEWAKAQAGAIPPRWYIWGSDGPDTFDCSGFICGGLKEVLGLDWTLTWWADRMWKTLEHTEDPQPGDLALYGTHRKATHVEMVVEGRYGPVIGASGGDSNTRSVADAQRMNAKVKQKPHVFYRKDFLGFCILSPLDRLPPRGVAVASEEPKDEGSNHG